MFYLRNSICLAVLVIFTFLYSNGQNAQYNHPLENVFQKGMQALQQGDSLTAYLSFKSAYTFSEKTDEIDYYYLALSIALEKPNVENIVIQWINNSNNRIYKSRLQYLLGKYYFKQQKDQLAIQCYKSVSIDDLENHEIILMKFQQGYLYFKTGDWDKATPLLNSIRQVKSNKFYADANYYAGFIALERKEFKLALDCFTIASTSNAYNKLAPFYISQLYYFLGDVNAAMENCEKALQQKGQYYELQLQQLMGHLLFEKKSYQKALPYLEHYVSTQKKVETQDLYQLSFCYFQSQLWDKAIDGFKQLAIIEDSLGQNSMYLLATSYLKINDKVGAKNAFLLCSTKSQNLSQKEIASFNYAKLSLELKEYSISVAAFDKFISTYPNSEYTTEANNLWVAALALSNNYQQALEAYSTIESPSTDLLKLYPNMLYGRACLYVNDGQYEKAMGMFKQVLNIPYNSKVMAPSLFWLGELSYKTGTVNESIAYLEQFIKDPIEQDEVSVKHAKYTLGYGYLKTNNYSKAAEYFSATLIGTPISLYEQFQNDAYVRIADCQMMQKQFKKSLQSYQRVIDLSWSYIDYATLQKANILGGMGQLNEKIKILTTFETQFKDSKYSNDARIELADTYVSQEKFQDAISPLNKILLDKNAANFYPQAYYKLGIVYFNLDKNEVALQTFRDLFSAYPKSTESDNSIEFIRNIFIENQTPELFVQFMNDFGKSLSTNEQDSLIYRSAIIKYDQNKYNEAAIGFSKYLQAFANGKYQLDANYLLAEIAYSKDQYDTAAKYFGIVANQSPNKYAERAALLAARLNYFNLKHFEIAEQYFTILNQIAVQQENKLEAIKGLLRCQYKAGKWKECAVIAEIVLQDKAAATDDIQMSNMAIYRNNLILKDTTGAIKLLNNIIKSNPSLITAEAHFELAQLFLLQNKLALAEKTAFEVIKKQSAYDYWVTKSYILLGDIYVAQNDHFNAIATYKSISENAEMEELRLIAADKLKALNENSNKIK